MTKGIIASLSAAAVLTTGAIFGASAMNAAPTPAETPTAVVVTVEEDTLRQETPETQRPTVVIPPVPVAEAPVVEAPVVQAPAPAPAPEAWVNPNGSVEGTGCPSPYVDNGYGCQVAICGIDAQGNEIACQ